MRTNSLGRITLRYVRECSKIKLTPCSRVIPLDNVMRVLEGVRLKKGYLAEAITPAMKGSGGKSIPYAYKIANEPFMDLRREFMIQGFTPFPLPDEHRCDIMDCMDVDFSEQGIWSAYLVSVLDINLPLFWHAAYYHEDLVYDLDRLSEICKGLRDDEGKLTSLSGDDSLLPHVEILDDHHAVTFYTYWSQWEGLVKKYVYVKEEDGRLTFSFPTHEILIAYNCHLLL